jgi:hypothetical protein
MRNSGATRVSSVNAEFGQYTEVREARGTGGRTSQLVILQSAKLNGGRPSRNGFAAFVLMIVSVVSRKDYDRLSWLRLFSFVLRKIAGD